MPNPWDRDKVVGGAPWMSGRVVASMPGAGAKPSSGYTAVGGPITPQTYIPGGENDPAVAARLEAAKAAARSGVETAAQRRMMQERADLEVQTHARIKAVDEGNIGSAAVPSSDKHGADYLPQIPQGLRPIVQGVASGNLAPPTGAALRSPYWQQVIQHVVNYDPSFAQQDYGTRAKMRGSLAGGTFGNTVNSINTALQHGSEVAADAQALGNFGGMATPLNVLRNAGRGLFGSDLPTNFKTDVGHYGDEMTKVFANGAGSAGERMAAANAVPLNGSPAQQAGALQHNTILLKGKLDAMNDEYQRAMGKTNSVFDLLSPEARKTYQTLLANGGVPGGPTVASGPPQVSGGNSPPPNGGGPPSTPASPDLPGSPSMTIATGPTKRVDDPGIARAVATMVKGGASADDINAAFPGHTFPADQIKAVQDFYRTHPNYTGPASVQAYHDEPVSTASRLAGSPLGAVVAGAADAVIPAGMMGQNAKQAVSALQEAHPGYSLAGAMIGGIPMAAGAELGAARLLPGAEVAAPRLADAAYGAYQGFGNAAPGEGVEGAALGAGAGMLSGMAGRQAVRAAGSLAQGVTNPAVQYLRGQGVPLTAGQALGGTAKTIEDQLTGYPLVGGIVKARRDEGLTGFNRAMFNQAADGSGVPITNIGERGAEQLDQAVNAAYAPLDNVHMTADPQMMQGLAAAGQRAQGIPGRGDDFNFIMQDRVQPNFDPQTGATTGRNVQDMIRGLRQQANSQPVGAMHPEAFATSLGDAEEAITGMVQRQAPEAMDALNTGNRVYRNSRIVDEAVKAARNQRGPDGDALVMPSQLNTASVSGTNKFGGRDAAATTDRPFYDLATNGQEVMPSKVGDSGTAGRLALGSALTLAAGGGAGVGSSEGGDWTSTGEGGASGLAAMAGLAALGGSRGGQRALVSLLADRPDLLRRFGTSIYGGANIGGVLALPYGAQAALAAQ